MKNRGHVGITGRRLRERRMILLAGILAGLPAGWVAMAVPRPTPPLENYDIRARAPGEAASLAAEVTGRAPQETARALRERSRVLAAEAARLRRALPGTRVRPSPFLAGAEVVSRPGRALAEPAAGRDDVATVREFLRRHAAVFGLTGSQVEALHVAGESAGSSGVRVLRLQQLADGRPVFQGEVRALLGPGGDLVSLTGRLAPDLPEAIPRPPELPPRATLRAALQWAGIEIDTTAVREPHATAGPWSETLVNDKELPRPVRSRPVYFPLAPGAVVPARSYVIVSRSAGDWYVVVDGRTGALLFRKSLHLDVSTQEARFSVYARSDGVPADSPSPASPSTAVPGSGTQFPEIAPIVLEMSAVQDPLASPDGWIPDGGETTMGNNVDAYLDRNADDLPDASLDFGTGRPVGNPDAFGRNRDFLGAGPRDFEYTPPPAGGDPDAGDSPFLAASQRGIVTQLFVLANVFHDRLYRLGFDESAGNYQVDNFGRGGLAGDPILAVAQWASAFFCCNAGVTPTPDGVPAALDMGVFTHSSPARDASLDAEVVLHELTHALTSRVVGNASGLTWAPGGALGEGWSDFYALSLLNDQPTDDPDGRYALGAWMMYRYGGAYADNYVYGTRRFPYSTDNSVNPLTWADVDDTSLDLSGGLPPSPLNFQRYNAYEVHNAGEMWALSLWEVRSRIIADHGDDVAAGNEIALQIVTDALSATPLSPGFAEARDALFVADCAANACANEESIWSGFADRGLGYGAEASLGFTVHAGIRESFELPHLDVGQIAVDDSIGNGDGFLDPGETISITVEMVNPWLEAAKGVGSATATLSSSSPEVAIQDAFAGYGPIPAQGTATGDTLTFTLDPAAACGESLHFSLQTDSALGSSSAPFTLRVGRPTGPGSPAVFTRVIDGGLSIPDAQGLVTFPVRDSMSLAADLEIVDLDLRIDQLLHTAVGDLSIALKAPGGFATDLILRPGECDPGSGTCLPGANKGDNFIGTVIDGEAGADLLTAGAAAAPFTGSWFPSINSPELGPADPVGQMGHYTGSSTQGTWHLLVVDWQSPDSGQLDSWSLIVTPMEYACDCDPFDPGADAVPGEIANLGLSQSAGQTLLSWDPAQPSAGSDTVHDVVRGDLAQPGGSKTCLATGVFQAGTADSTLPAPNHGFFYVVRGRNACGVGTYGFTSAQVERLTSACPD